MMATLMRKWDEVLKNADPRVADWFMMSTPLPSFIICFLYVVIVKLGPWLMRDRKPFEMKNVLLAYNLVMVIISAYTLEEFLNAGWLAGYSLRCEPVDYSTSPQALRMAKVCWLFYITKFLELFDTIFFIMRKKFNQVSFLHVFHHGIMPVSWWFGVKFVPGGFGTFHSTCNSFIHFMMYTYYGLAALGPEYQKYLWWKKYMTKMQIIQFICVVIHTAQLLFIECNYPKTFVYIIGSYAFVFLVMFADFYFKTYKAKRSETQKSTHIKNGTAGKRKVN
ncbi:elongation of very long chain fatty acids protein 7-like [Gigantopelta aegis]|uniref:elongation of very long chain fatty acids protein 7-like n=1 Tax=Gigantopelta aegis TaxID=1735272 RepID=UPI001B8895E6|nr:elongation of very long chain fatty acids protein 7-like [Gigantopelta aegis]